MKKVTHRFTDKASTHTKLPFALFLTLSLASSPAWAEPSDQDNQATDNAVRTLPAAQTRHGEYDPQSSLGFGLQYSATYPIFRGDTPFDDTPSFMGGLEGRFEYNFLTSSQWITHAAGAVRWDSPYKELDHIFGVLELGIGYHFEKLESILPMELIVGTGAGYGRVFRNAKLPDGTKQTVNGPFTIPIRIFLEYRLLPTEWVAPFVRAEFQYTMVRDKENELQSSYAQGIEPDMQVGVALGVLFGSYHHSYLRITDNDGDGIHDDVDFCPNSPGVMDYSGCINPDPDNDRICDAWVSDGSVESLTGHLLTTSFAPVCKGIDKCPNEPEDYDNFEDEDGCPDPNPDKDGDKVCDAWVKEQNQEARFAPLCSGVELCEDTPGELEFQGCPNPDSDKDGVCAPWVTEKGLADHFKDICTGIDHCTTSKGTLELHGCTLNDIDHDGDKICDAWVTTLGYAKLFQNACTGIDACPNEPGKAELHGCLNPDPDNDKLCSPWVKQEGFEEKFKKICSGVDACPNEPEDVDGYLDNDGCSEENQFITYFKEVLTDQNVINRSYNDVTNVLKRVFLAGGNTAENGNLTYFSLDNFYREYGRVISPKMQTADCSIALMQTIINKNSLLIVKAINDAQITYSSDIDFLAHAYSDTIQKHWEEDDNVFSYTKDKAKDNIKSAFTLYLFDAFTSEMCQKAKNYENKVMSNK